MLCILAFNHQLLKIKFLVVIGGVNIVLSQIGTRAFRERKKKLQIISCIFSEMKMRLLNAKQEMN